MMQSLNTKPYISSLDPDTVETGWNGVVKINGRGFDNGSVALFNGRVPKTTFRSESLLEADVTNEITGTPGTLKVKVHTSGGDLSNDVPFVVESSTSRKM